MTDSTRTAMAAGMAAGYLLGRSKKGKVAFAVASFAVGRKISLSPRDLLVDGLRKLCDSPQCRQLTEQVQGDLLTSGRSALKAVVDRELGGFADMLADRTRVLGDRRTGGEQQEEKQEQQEQQGQQAQQRQQEEQAEQAEQAGQEEQQQSQESASSHSDAAAETADELSSPQTQGRRRPSREPLEPRRPAPRRPARPRPSARVRGGESR